MISIIICSRTKEANSALSENIKNTVACPYELIIIDNSKNKHSIFDAYNKGIERSKGDYLCFIHDDVLFSTNEWGSIIKRIFSEDQRIGLIGLAGAKSKTKMPSVWWLSPNGDNVINIIQHRRNKEKEEWNFGFDNGLNTEAVTVDGVFMAMRKDDRIRFNSEMEGFHNYDLNISFECIKFGYKIIVTNEILIEHFSTGIINEQWVESSYQLYALYKNWLPLCLKDNMTNKKQEIANGLWFINECLKFKKYKIAFTIWVKLFYLNPFLLFHLIYWKNNFRNNFNILTKYFIKNGSRILMC